jgi:hypothetical protein
MKKHVNWKKAIEMITQEATDGTDPNIVADLLRMNGLSSPSILEKLSELSRHNSSSEQHNEQG